MTERRYLHLRIATWNVNGITKPDKREFIINKIKSSYDIVFLQEIHNLHEATYKYIQSRLGHLIMSPGVGNQAGVAIYINPHTADLQPINTSIQTLHAGRIICLEIYWRHQKIKIYNIYAPAKKEEQPEFFNYLHQQLTNAQYPTIIGGDFNLEEKCSSATVYVPV